MIKYFINDRATGPLELTSLRRDGRVASPEDIFIHLKYTVSN